jgi:hypothetical protein
LFQTEEDEKLTIIHTDVIDYRNSHMNEIRVEEMSDDSKGIVIVDGDFSVFIWENVNREQHTIFTQKKLAHTCISTRISN